jgi:hypothetical protein
MSTLETLPTIRTSCGSATEISVAARLRDDPPGARFLAGGDFSSVLSQIRRLYLMPVDYSQDVGADETLKRLDPGAFMLKPTHPGTALMFYAPLFGCRGLDVEVVRSDLLENADAMLVGLILLLSLTVLLIGG